MSQPQRALTRAGALGSSGNRERSGTSFRPTALTSVGLSLRGAEVAEGAGGAATAETRTVHTTNESIRDIIGYSALTTKCALPSSFGPFTTYLPHELAWALPDAQIHSGAG